jgi:hypothetical protein
MSKMTRKAAIVLTTIASLGAMPALADTKDAQMQACLEAFTSEHLPSGPKVTLKVASDKPGVQVVSLPSSRPVSIELTARAAGSGDVLASATCDIGRNGNLTITPAGDSRMVASS